MCSDSHYLLLIYTVICEEGDARLVYGDVVNEGRVEICIDETWSTICDNGWSLNDANVVCQQLGYAGIGMRVSTDNACMKSY